MRDCEFFLRKVLTRAERSLYIAQRMVDANADKALFLSNTRSPPAPLLPPSRQSLLRSTNRSRVTPRHLRHQAGTGQSREGWLAAQRQGRQSALLQREQDGRHLLGDQEHRDEDRRRAGGGVR